MLVYCSKFVIMFQSHSVSCLSAVVTLCTCLYYSVCLYVSVCLSLCHSVCVLQLPAYEFSFSDVNPPVHAWSCLHVYHNTAPSDVEFLRMCFHQLVPNFTWL